MAQCQQARRTLPCRVVALVILAFGVFIQDAKAWSLNFSDPTKAERTTIGVCNDGNDAVIASGHRACPPSQRQALASESSQVLEVPDVIDSPNPNSAGHAFPNSAGHALRTNDQDNNGGPEPRPASLDSGTRQFMSEIRGQIGTVEDYESRAKEPNFATICIAPQWWWTSGVAVCKPMRSPSGAAGHP